MPLTAEQAALILKSELRTLIAEHPTTTRVIEAIPAERADFRPDGVAKSAFDLAWHLVSAEHLFLNAAGSGAFDYSSTQRPEGVRAPADIVAWYADRFAADVERLRAVSGDDLLKTIDFRGVRQMPALSFAQLALHHSIHHRGQLSMYLRPMGAKVPSIYGESYDARQAREAAATP
jgi:uncharacterized damage-inducible protein DinB